MIDKDMTVIDIMLECPETEMVFREYENLIGKCLMCNHLFDTIAQIAQESKLDSTSMIKKLNERRTAVRCEDHPDSG